MTVALTSPQLAALRSNTTPHRSKQYLSQVPDEAFATARINQASFDNSTAVLTVDTTSALWNSISMDMTVWIGTTAGTRDIGCFLVRDKTPTTLSIGELSPGDFGFVPVATLRSLADNAYLTIIADFRAAMKDPRIDYTGGLTGTFYKNYSEGYTDQNETGGHTPAVVNVGKHPAGWVDTVTGQMEYVWTANVTALEPGVTVSTYSWNLGGGDLHSGSLTAYTCTARYDPGYYLTSLTVTLSNGVVIQVFRHVWAHDPVDYPPTPIIAIRSDRQTVLGRRMTIELDTPIDTLPIQNGMMGVVWEDAHWGSTAIADAPLNFAGWANPHAAESLPGQNTATFDLIGPLEFLQGQQAYAQELTVKANPANWQEVSESLAYLDFWQWYLLYYHTTVWRIFDVFLPGYTNRIAPVWAVQPGNIVDQLNEAGQRMNVQVACASNGAIWFKTKFHLQTESGRTGNLTRLTVTSHDFTNLRYQKRFAPEVGQVLAEGFRYAGGQLSPLQSAAPGIVAGFGGSTTTLGGQLITGQAELDERAANEYAYLNMPIKAYTLEFQRNYDVLDVAWRMVIGLTLAADEWPENVPISGQVCEVVEIERRYLAGGAKDVIWTVEPEAIGYNTPGQAIDIIGTQVDVETLDIPTYDPATGDIQIPFDPFDPGTYPDVQDYFIDDVAAKSILVAWTDDIGALAVNDPLRPLWASVFDEGETMQAMLLNPASPRLTTDRKTGALGIYVLTNAGLYYNENVLDPTEVFTLQEPLQDYTILRAVRGVLNGVAVFGPDVANEDGGYDVTFDSGSDATYDEWLDPGHATDGQGVSTGGNPGNCWRNVRSGFAYAWVRVDLGSEQTVTSFSADWGTFNGAAPASYDFTVSFLDDTEAVVGTNVGLSGGQNVWHSESWTGTRAGVRYVVFAVNGQEDARIDNLHVGTDESAFSAAIYYSTNNGATGTQLTVAPDFVGGGGYDVDDFGLGTHIASGGDSLRYTATYTGSVGSITGISTPGGGAIFNLVRIPFLRPSTNLRNNSDTALHVVWGTDDDISGETLWEGTLNTTTGAMSNINDCTPIIGGDTYVINGPNALEINGKDARLWLAFAQILGDTQIDLIGSDDAGVTWEVRQANFPGVYVRWVEGSLTEAYLGAEDGAWYTDDRGATTVNVTTNLEDFDDVPVLGVIG